MISSSSFFCPLLICTQKLSFQTNAGGVVSAHQRKYCQSRKTFIKFESGNVLFFNVFCVFLEPAACGTGEPWMLSDVQQLFPVMLLSVKGAGDPCSAYQLDKELGMALKGGRKSWETNLGWAFPAPCSGKHCKKLDSLGKCSYKWLLFFSCLINNERERSSKIFLFHKGPSVNNKKR